MIRINFDSLVPGDMICATSYTSVTQLVVSVDKSKNQVILLRKCNGSDLISFTTVYKSNFTNDGGWVKI